NVIPSTSVQSREPVSATTVKLPDDPLERAAIEGCPEHVDVEPARGLGCSSPTPFDHLLSTSARYSWAATCQAAGQDLPSGGSKPQVAASTPAPLSPPPPVRPLS